MHPSVHIFNVSTPGCISVQHGFAIMKGTRMCGSTLHSFMYLSLRTPAPMVSEWIFFVILE